MRGLPVFFALMVLLQADPLEDAARALAKKIGARISPGDNVRITERNISSLPATEASRARQTLERSMRRSVRNGTPVDVLLTLSQNPREAVLAAEGVKAEARWVEVVTYRLADSAPRGTMQAIEKRLLWQQVPQLLDVREVERSLLVLDVNELAVYEGGQRVRGWPMPVAARDAVARLNVEGDRITVQTPERECQGTWRPEVKLECTVAGEPGNLWRIASMPPHYSMARMKNMLHLFAEPDGRTHLYNAQGQAIGSWSGWGSDMAAICSNRVVASSDRERGQGDTLRVFEIVEGKPVPASEPLEVPGSVMTLSSLSSGVTAIVEDSPSHYVAYHLLVDCSR